MNASFFALALAAALLDVTVGFPDRLEAAVGAPARWLALWLRTVEGAAAGLEGRLALVLYLAPAMVAGAVVDILLPYDATGFVVRAVLASTLCGRQSLDRRVCAAALAWERDGPGEAMVAIEALGAREDETRLASASAAALAARFADEVVGPSVFMLLGGLVGAVFFRGVAVAARRARLDTKIGGAVANLESWTLAPVSRLAALWIALASGRRAPFAAAMARASRATEPAEAAMLAALGPARRDEPDYLRSGLALYRRAAALELAALALMTVAAAMFFYRAA